MAISTLRHLKLAVGALWRLLDCQLHFQLVFENSSPYFFDGLLKSGRLLQPPEGDSDVNERKTSPLFVCNRHENFKSSHQPQRANPRAKEKKNKNCQHVAGDIFNVCIGHKIC
ncbi:MAG: hypothetical protein M3367_03280 [Acidobacteriota bacterium]|nr:hypothetical protein [Acidobacteriota bacterium]